MSIEISVAIPARNSEKFIAQTLQAIQQGTYHPAEILVVDGCSTDQTALIARSFGAKIVENPMLHTASARNIGVIEAKSPIIAFTDSDCVPASNWLEQIAFAFLNDPQLDGVGGPVLLSRPKNQIQAYSAHVFESIKSFPEQPTLITKKGVGGLSFAGANCAFTRQKVIESGNFRDQFSNMAEEVDLLWRLVDNHARLLFDPQIVVEHLGYPETIRGLLQTNFRHGATSTYLTKYHKRSPRIDWSLYKKLFHSLIAVVNPWNHDSWAGLRVIQLSAFIAAKWYTSIRIKTINL
jgi:glycosyltransferase involved in cell wall biosynthesis